MIGKSISRTLIIGGPGRNDVGRVQHMRATSADSWGTIPLREPSLSDGGLCRKGIRAVCSILLAVFFAGTILGIGSERNMLVRLPPRRAASAGSGVASWYGHPYHGRLAANGRIYDMHQLTAAHRTLPLGTRVRVYNLENSRAVDVSITDRGPFVDGRLIDVSLAAALILGMNEAGVARVWFEVLSLPIRPAPAGVFPVKDAISQNSEE